MQVFHNFRCVICFLALMLIVIPFNGSYAKDSLRKLDANDIKKITSNKTFWRSMSTQTFTLSMDRIYFSNNGNFTQQINDGWKNLPFGTILSGQWTIENETLCWKYDENSSKTYNITSRKTCFDIYTTNDSEAPFMTNHHDRLHFKPANTGINGPTIFYTDLWFNKSFILDPQLSSTIEKDLAKVREYGFLHKGSVAGGTHDRSKISPSFLPFYDYLVHRILYVEEWYFFFDDNGLVYHIKESDIKKYNYNIDKIIPNVSTAKWTVKDNIFCYSFPNGVVISCDFILPKGQGLTRPHDSFLSINMYGIVRLYENGPGHPVGIMDVKDSLLPELFIRLQQK